MDKDLEMITRHAEAGSYLRIAFFATQGELVAQTAKEIVECLKSGGKVLLAGNGGSAADAQHWAGEFVNRFLMNRQALPAIALTTDTSVMTAIANDFSYDQIFARQIEALAKPDDVFLAISTSGNSPNILEALRVAHKKNVVCIGMSSGNGGKMAELCDLMLNVPTNLLDQMPLAVDKSKEQRGELMLTPLIQEVHEAAGHLICALVEKALCEQQPSSAHS